MSEPGSGYITKTPRQHEPIDQVYPSEFHYHRLLDAPNITIWVSMGFFLLLQRRREWKIRFERWRGKKTGNGDG